MEYTITYSQKKTVVDIKRENVFGFAIGRGRINSTLVSWIIVIPLLIIEISLTTPRKDKNLNIL